MYLSVPESLWMRMIFFQKKIIAIKELERLSVFKCNYRLAFDFCWVIKEYKGLSCFPFFYFHHVTRRKTTWLFVLVAPSATHMHGQNCDWLIVVVRHPVSRFVVITIIIIILPSQPNISQMTQNIGLSSHSCVFKKKNNNRRRESFSLNIGSQAEEKELVFVVIVIS